MVDFQRHLLDFAEQFSKVLAKNMHRQAVSSSFENIGFLSMEFDISDFFFFLNKVAGKGTTITWNDLL